MFPSVSEELEVTESWEFRGSEYFVEVTKSEIIEVWLRRSDGSGQLFEVDGLRSSHPGVKLRFLVRVELEGGEKLSKSLKHEAHLHIKILSKSSETLVNLVGKDISALIDGSEQFIEEIKDLGEFNIDGVEDLVELREVHLDNLIKGLVLSLLELLDS